uniref:2.4 kDa venom peptide n=1 Tax=Heterometrus spinifer TaxID=118530 RepID=VP24_HETSP|nr:RecName: Full=2.4 kDa venom peptide [Heterometrus spinifer]
SNVCFNACMKISSSQKTCQILC